MCAQDHSSGPELVDVTLIDESLALSLEERLRQNDRMLRTIEELRRAFAGADESADGLG